MSASVHHRVAEALRASWCSGAVISITWVNHHSAQVLLTHDATLLDRFDLVGVDGVLLQSLVKTPYARIAGGGDVTLPLLLPLLDGARVALVGGTPDETQRRKLAVEAVLAPGAAVVVTTDGYQGCPTVPELPRWLDEHRPDVVIVGMGAGLQDEFALEVAGLLRHGVVATCGGWMDQLARPRGYYPSWVYRARLNWAVRLIREPRRLGSRYSKDAVAAVAQRKMLVETIHASAGYDRYCRVATKPVAVTR